MFKKFSVFVLTVLLTVSVGMVALAEVDLGLSQDTNANTLYRIDAGNFLFEVPVKESLDAFSLGATIPTEFWNSYGIAKLNFKKYTKFHFESLAVGLGYPIEFGDFVLRGELEATNPNWIKFKETAISADFSLQFSWDALLPETE